MRSELLRIAEMTIALRCDDPRLDWQWTAASRRFLVSGGQAILPGQDGQDGLSSTPDVQLTVRGAEHIPPHDGELVFESGGVWRLLRDGDGFRVECHAPVFANNPYKIARFDASFTRGEILLTQPVWHLGPLDYPLDELLVIHLLGRGRGVEFHSCGIIDHSGRGRLFVGMSGAGKTTTARLWGSAAAAIVSDDRVIVREHDGAMRMFGTPWHGEGELSLPASAPLAGVYLLTQSSSNEIRALSHPEAVARMFGCVFPPFHDAAAVDFTLAFLDRLAQQVPVRELAFTRDASVVDLVLAEAA